MSKKSMNHLKSLTYILFLFYILFFSIGCSTTKYVSPEDSLLKKVILKNDVPTVSNSEIFDYIKQTPNNYVFKIWPLGLNIYNLSGRDTTNWFNKQIRKIGEKPIIYNKKDVEYSTQQIKQLLFNKGYMNASVKSKTQIKNRRATITYEIKGNKPYKIDHYFITLPDTLASNIVTNKDKKMLKDNDFFDTKLLDQERTRISNTLRNNGYYHFQKDLLFFTADTTDLDHLVNTEISIKEQYLLNDSLLENTFSSYKFGEINIISNKANSYNITTYTNQQNPQFNILQDRNNKQFRNNMLLSKCMILPDSLYSDKAVQKTYNAYNALHAIKYVDIDIKKNTKTQRLDSYIYITQNKPHSYEINIEGTNSNGDLGAGLNAHYINNNIFKGAEKLKIGIHGAYEVVGPLDQTDPATEFGGNIGLEFPNILIPFTGINYKRNNPGTTEISANISFQNRPEYQRNLANAALKYRWKYRGINFSLNAIDISYIYLPRITDKFKDNYLKPSSSIRFSYEDQLIFRLGLDINYSNYRNTRFQKNYYTIKAGIRTAGNTLYLNSILSNAKVNKNGHYELFNIQYAQYVKGYFDYTYNLITSPQTRLVFHAAMGASTPYGNADIIPFEERFYSGGANSVRGWSVRTLGPGRFQNQSSIDFMRQSGDINLCFNVESRFKLFWKLDGAFFYDMGNVWTIKSYKDQPHGAFDFNTFYQEMGMSYGMGLRLDFDFFIIRIDGGLKLYDPSLLTNQRWRLHPKLNQDAAIHFAIGYPF